MEKGDREGQWHAHFPRNDRLCCSYEPHILLANMGNIDWRPVLNLWAVVQYVTKYATKAPKGSRKLHEVLKDAVDEVCTYVPEGEGADFLRRSIQKFFARSFGERDFHAYEAVQLGLESHPEPVGSSIPSSTLRRQGITSFPPTTSTVEPIPSSMTSCPNSA